MPNLTSGRRLATALPPHADAPATKAATSQQRRHAFLDAIDRNLAVDTPTAGENFDTTADPAARLPSGWYTRTGPARKTAASKRPGLIEPVKSGLGLGLSLAVPAMIFAWSMQPASRPAIHEADLAALARRIVADARPRPDAPDDIVAKFLPSHFVEAQSTPSADNEADLKRAVAQIEAGDVASARNTLATAATARNAAALFLLAETYDPVRLSDWGAVENDGNTDQARRLYAAAAALGHPLAAPRLARFD